MNFIKINNKIKSQKKVCVFLFILILAVAGVFALKNGHSHFRGDLAEKERYVSNKTNVFYNTNVCNEINVFDIVDVSNKINSSNEVNASLETGVQEEVYPEPAYDFKTEEVTIAIDGISKPYTIAWVSDLHVVSDHETGDALGDVRVEYLDAVNNRYEGLSVTADGVHAEELWPEIIKYLNYNEFDGVIFGGDIMDYCSNANVALIKEGLDNLRIPYIYVRADHDYGAYYGGVSFTETEARELHKTIDGDVIANKFWDRDDFVILGIDNSTKNMPEYYFNMVAEVHTRGKPVIMVTHVPYESKVDDSLAELSMQARNTIYYWSAESDHYKPNDITRRYLDLIYRENTMVKQVLAGHLHASWDGMISSQVPQHIFSPAFSGTIGIIHIVPKQ